MPELVILGLPPSSCVRTALLVCENKGVDHRLQPVDFRSPEYRQQHPFSRMPALEHGNVKLFEALAIATYIDEALDGPPLQPESPAIRAEMLQWISATNDYLYDSIVRRCVSERFVKPMRGLDPDEELIANALPTITMHLDVLDDALADRTFFCGDRLTLADLFVGPIISYFAATPEGKSTMPDRSNLSGWLNAMADTTGYTRINKIGR